MNIPFDSPTPAFAVLDEGDVDVRAAYVCMDADDARDLAGHIGRKYGRTAVVQPIGKSPCADARGNSLHQPR